MIDQGASRGGSARRKISISVYALFLVASCSCFALTRPLLAFGTSESSDDVPVQNAEEQSSLASALAQAKTLDSTVALVFIGDREHSSCQLFREKLIDQSEVMDALREFSVVVLFEEDELNDGLRRISDRAVIDATAEQYNVRAVPALILIDSSGRPITRMVGYSGETSNQLIDELEYLVEQKLEFERLMTRAGTRTGIDRAKSLDVAMDHLPSAWVMGHYRDVVFEIIALDHDNRERLRMKYELASARYDIDPSNLHATITRTDELLERVQMTQDEIQQVHYMQAAILYDIDRERSFKMFLTAYEDLPDSELAHRIRHVVERAFDEAQIDQLFQ